MEIGMNRTIIDDILPSSGKKKSILFYSNNLNKSGASPVAWLSKKPQRASARCLHYNNLWDIADANNQRAKKSKYQQCDINEAVGNDQGKKDLLVVGQQITLQIKERKNCLSTTSKDSATDGLKENSKKTARPKQGNGCSSTENDVRTQAEKQPVAVGGAEERNKATATSGEVVKIQHKQEYITNVKKKNGLSLAERRDSEITITLPQGNSSERFAVESPMQFNRTSYLVCTNSPSVRSGQRLTSVLFPNELWKLKRRASSGRRQSSISSVSSAATFINFDMLSRTPQNTPFGRKEDVFTFDNSK
eukprot:gene19943-21896_t